MGKGRSDESALNRWNGRYREPPAVESGRTDEAGLQLFQRHAKDKRQCGRLFGRI